MTDVNFATFPFITTKIMHDALSEITNFGFNILDLRSIEANMNPQNVSSIKFLKKSNFIRKLL